MNKILKDSYKAKLKDPRWQKKRLEVLLRDAWTCQSCGDDTKTLHVHHKVYGRGEPWDVPLSNLITLCEFCHETESLERAELEQKLIYVLRKSVGVDQIGYLISFYETQNKYFDALEDQKWLDREKELIKNKLGCFICHTDNDITLYHKSLYFNMGKKPWELPDTEFDFICRSCNRKNNGSYINIYDYLDLLLPAFHRAGYYSDDIVDLITDPYLGKFIKLVLEEIKKERLSCIPSQFSDAWRFKKNITYDQLYSLREMIEQQKK